mmetsp:Transcript_39844/g.82838  ORF Transcript_39844/g.82838 Transcript_39844/m.82838 type:complete len:322 (+) Transcript_39844:814-1779(+)
MLLLWWLLLHVRHVRWYTHGLLSRWLIGIGTIGISHRSTAIGSLWTLHHGHHSWMLPHVLLCGDRGVILLLLLMMRLNLLRMMMVGWGWWHGVHHIVGLIRIDRRRGSPKVGSKRLGIDIQGKFLRIGIEFEFGTGFFGGGGFFGCGCFGLFGFRFGGRLGFRSLFFRLLLLGGSFGLLGCLRFRFFSFHDRSRFFHFLFGWFGGFRFGFHRCLGCGLLFFGLGFGLQGLGIIHGRLAFVAATTGRWYRLVSSQDTGMQIFFIVILNGTLIAFLLNVHIGRGFRFNLFGQSFGLLNFGGIQGGFIEGGCVHTFIVRGMDIE